MNSVCSVEAGTSGRPRATRIQITPTHAHGHGGRRPPPSRAGGEGHVLAVRVSQRPGTVDGPPDYPGSRPQSPTRTTREVDGARLAETKVAGPPGVEGPEAILADPTLLLAHAAPPSTRPGRRHRPPAPLRGEGEALPPSARMSAKWTRPSPPLEELDDSREASRSVDEVSGPRTTSMWSMRSAGSSSEFTVPPFKSVESFRGMPSRSTRVKFESPPRTKTFGPRPAPRWKAGSAPERPGAHPWWCAPPKPPVRRRRPRSPLPKLTPRAALPPLRSRRRPAWARAWIAGVGRLAPTD